MTKKRRQRRRDHSHLIAHQGEPERLAALLAPPEESAAAEEGARGNGGAIVVDTDDLKLPKDFTEREDERSGLFGIEPIGLIILAFALAFIALVAYLIYTEPPKPAEDPRAASAPQ